MQFAGSGWCCPNVSLNLVVGERSAYLSVNCTTKIGAMRSPNTDNLIAQVLMKCDIQPGDVDKTLMRKLKNSDDCWHECNQPQNGQQDGDCRYTGSD